MRTRGRTVAASSWIVAAWKITSKVVGFHKTYERG
jgi:hypothetical protein